MATTAGPSSPSPPLPSTASTLWAHLLRPRAPSGSTSGAQIPAFAQLTPQDKASTSTRILLHDTQARLEKFSERASVVFSEVEASRREMVRVREEVEGAREKELEAIVQLVNRCQSFLQKAIGDPVQAREAASIQANLTLALERLSTLDDKTNGKLESLTALLQTHSQTSQSLQAQLSCLQSQQNRILELLAPLHPILQSVPLHIDIARNAIIEKIPEGCQGTKPCSSPTPSVGMTPPSGPDSELFLVSRKRRRISLDTPRLPTLRRYQGLDQHMEQPVERTEETQDAVQERRTATLSSTVQTPSGSRKNGSSGSHLTLASGSYPEKVTDRPGSRNAAVAPRLSAIVEEPSPNKTVGGKGIASPITVFPHSKSAKDNPISYIARPPAVPGKRFLIFDDDDDDSDDI